MTFVVHIYLGKVMEWGVRVTKNHDSFARKAGYFCNEPFSSFLVDF